MNSTFLLTPFNLSLAVNWLWLGQLSLLKLWHCILGFCQMLLKFQSSIGSWSACRISSIFMLKTSCWNVVIAHQKRCCCFPLALRTTNFKGLPVHEKHPHLVMSNWLLTWHKLQLCISCVILIMGWGFFTRSGTWLLFPHDHFLFPLYSCYLVTNEVNFLVASLQHPYDQNICQEIRCIEQSVDMVCNKDWNVHCSHHSLKEI